MEDDHARHIVRVYVGSLSQEYEALSVEASKHTTAEEIVQCIVLKLGFSNPNDYEVSNYKLHIYSVIWATTETKKQS